MKTNKKTKVVRASKRGFYDKETILTILNANYFCTIAFVFEGYPVAIPTNYGSTNDSIYIHGATVSRLMVSLEKEIPISINVTEVNGIVLAKSAFNHSLNYRSVTLFGNAVLVKDEDERQMALKLISDQIIPGRWEEVRKPNEKEMKATKILKIEITEASAKIRTGPPIDEKADLDLPIWSGVLPITKTFGNLVYDSANSENMPIPESLKKLISKKD